MAVWNGGVVSRSTLIILAIIGFWAWLIVSLSGTVETWHPLIQLVFYLVAGIVWIAPLKPLLRWMETGRWR